MSSSDLPHGWKAVHDDNTGRTYYWQYKTNKVSWTKPTADKASSGSLSKLRSLSRGSSGRNGTKDAKPAKAGVKPPSAAGSGGLPPDWQAVVDPSTKRTYYWNKATNEVSWHKPPSAAKELSIDTSNGSPKTKPGKGNTYSTGSGRRTTDLLSPRSSSGLTAESQSPPKGRKLLGALTSTGSRPNSARKLTTKMFSKDKQRRGNVIAESFADDEHYEKRSYPKSEASRSLLTRVLHEHFLFHQLSAGELREAVDAMKETRLTKSGEAIIREGDKGDNFYVVESGAFDVLVGGRKVGEIGENGSFGELALLYNCPRAASVVKAKSGAGVTVAWGLDRATFRHMLRTSSATDMNETKQVLKTVPLLKSLTEDQLTRCAEAARVVQFGARERIIHKGELGDVFYIIRHGQVDVTDIDSMGGGSVVFGAGDYFGERALLNDEPRAANVVAKTNVELLALDRHAFNDFLGSLRELLDYNIRISVLQGVPLFRRLNPLERRELFGAFKQQTFKKGEYIIRQGDAGKTFYLVREGEAVVTQEVVISGKKSSTEVHVLETGAYFGEMALIEGGVRQANVIARTAKCECFSLDRDHFETLMGSAKEILSRKIEERKDENIRAKEELRHDMQRGAHHATDGGGIGLEEATPAGKRQRSRAASLEDRLHHIKLADLHILRTLGTGTFGRVKMVKHKVGGKVYALKIQSKAQIVQYKLQTNIVNEKLIMESLRHPFILRLYTTFKDRDRLYMVLEIVQGGELFSLLQNRGQSLTPDGHCFYAGCVVSAFAHLHERDILYRDLKPENLLIDTQGYLKVVDFGFAKIVKHRTYTLCGTPEYFSPELVLGKGYGKGNDYWAVGILIYEVINGYTPFGTCDDEQTVICRRICQSTLKFPDDFKSSTARDVITRLLTKDPMKRLGSNKEGIKGIKSHPFFQRLNWTKLEEKKIPAPWIPPIKDATDASNFDEYDEDDRVPRYIDDGSKQLGCEVLDRGPYDFYSDDFTIDSDIHINDFSEEKSLHCDLL